MAFELGFTEGEERMNIKVEVALPADWLIFEWAQNYSRNLNTFQLYPSTGEHSWHCAIQHCTDLTTHRGKGASAQEALIDAIAKI